MRHDAPIWTLACRGVSWTVFGVVLQLALAYGLAVLVFQVGVLIL